MDNKPKRTLKWPVCEYLAQTWLQQQDLSEKSAVEVADMYVSALAQIVEKYAPPKQESTGKHVRNHGIEIDPW